MMKYIPSLITLARIVLVPAIVLLATRHPWVAFTLFSFAAASDMCDGYAARCLQAESRFGAVFDTLADKILFFGVLVGFRSHIPVAVIVLAGVPEFLLLAMRGCVLCGWLRADLRATKAGKQKMWIQCLALVFLFVGYGAGVPAMWYIGIVLIAVGMLLSWRSLLSHFLFTDAGAGYA